MIMNPDLEWLAENVEQWKSDEYGCVQELGGTASFLHGSPMIYGSAVGRTCFTKEHWKQARIDLGLEPSGIADEGTMSDIPMELQWLAKNCSDMKGALYITPEMDGYSLTSKPYNHKGSYSYDQWLQARIDLGLEPSGISEPDEDECIQLAYERMNQKEDKYSAYFKDVRHIETLDVYRVIDLFSCEKHGHPISHAVKKLLLSGARTGGKDVESDVREAIDSLHRWLEMREEDRV